ncbi:MAG: ATP-binding protein, partial [Bacteroidota bacterium]|nr:ATP-binding protein [Bacteroidota bacterium]
MRRSCLLACLVLVLGVPSRAQVIHVPREYPTIQAGINAAEPGDTILVAEGTYYENIDFIGKPITLASHFLLDSDTSHISRTIINGSKAPDLTRASVVTLRSGEDSTSVLYGFTITGGTGTFLTDVHTEPDMKNWRNMCGGGILMHRSGGKIIHNIIEYNQVQTDSLRGAYGAGILANVNEGRTAIIRNNIIRNNSIWKNQGWGAGVCLFGGSTLLEHNAILDNSIDVKWLSVGAGIFYQNDSTEGGAQQVAIRNNVIAWNSAVSQDDLGLGGGIGLCFGFEEEVMEIHHNIICENHTNGIGGGLYSISGRGLVYGNLIFDNSADMYGASIATELEQRLVLDYNHLWSGPVWLASSNYFSKVHFNRELSESITSYLRNGDQFYTDRFSIDLVSESLFIGEKDGMLLFNPQAVPLNAFAPPMVIIDFRQFKPDVTAHRENQLNLSHRENFLKFKFSILELAETDIYQYSSAGYGFKYLLEGVDQDTAMTGMDLTAKYQNLKPGKYRFWVSRSDDQGNWDPEGISLRLRIHPPRYRSGLALGSYAVFMILMIIGITSYRTARLKKEKTALENEVARRTEELREKNAQILEMERLKTRFFTDVSHEIRTPLTLISGPLDQLVNQEYRNPRIIRWLSLIRRNSQRLVHLVNQLLDISRLDAGYMKLIMEESDVIAHLRMVAGEYFSLAESKGIEYIIDIPDQQMETCYDREKLEKVCANLLSNAFKFTSPGGTVTCGLKVLKGAPDSKDPQIRLLVADTGSGIPVRLKEKIFERFYRGEEDSSLFSEGTGIGLALTRELVSIMHGEILMRSQ